MASGIISGWKAAQLHVSRLGGAVVLVCVYQPRLPRTQRGTYMHAEQFLDGNYEA